MMTKITDRNMRTHDGYQWTFGQWFESSGKGRLGSPGWLHVYQDPLVGAFMNPVHGDYDPAKFFEAECDGKWEDDRGFKWGFTRVKLIREIEPPCLSTETRVAAAILSTARAYRDPEYLEWAGGWIDGKDRTEDPARKMMYEKIDPAECGRAGRAAWLASCAAVASSVADSTRSIRVSAWRWAARAAYMAALSASDERLDILAILREAKEKTK